MNFVHRFNYFFVSRFSDFLFLLMVYFSLIFGPYFGISQVATNFIVPFSFLYFVYKFPQKNIFRNKSIFLFTIFFIWTLFSSLFSIDYNQAFITEKKLSIVFIYTIIIYLYASISVRNSLLAYKTLINVLILFMILNFYSLSSLSSADIGQVRLDRLDNSGLDNELLGDTNNFGYFLFLGLSSAFLLYNVFYTSIFNKIKLVFLIIASFVIIQLTASRGSYVIFVLVVFSNFLIPVINLKISRYNKFFLFLIIILIIPLIVSLQSILIKGSILETRFEYAKQEQSTREMHANEAIKVGLNHPLLGVGGGNYAITPRSFERGSFSHNSYTEAFANYGLPGLVLLCTLYFEFLLKIISGLRKKQFKNKHILYYLLCFIIAFVVYNIFYVTYLTFEFMGLFILARTFLDHTFKENQQFSQSQMVYKTIET